MVGKTQRQAGAVLDYMHAHTRAETKDQLVGAVGRTFESNRYEKQTLLLLFFILYILSCAPRSVGNRRWFAKTGSGNTHKRTNSRTKRHTRMEFLVHQKQGSAGTDAAEGCAGGAKNTPFFSIFPMFVPSLSWQNDRLYT